MVSNVQILQKEIQNIYLYYVLQAIMHLCMEICVLLESNNSRFFFKLILTFFQKSFRVGLSRKGQKAILIWYNVLCFIYFLLSEIRLLPQTSLTKKESNAVFDHLKFIILKEIKLIVLKIIHRIKINFPYIFKGFN